MKKSLEPTQNKVPQKRKHGMKILVVNINLNHTHQNNFHGDTSITNNTGNSTTTNKTELNNSVKKTFASKNLYSLLYGAIKGLVKWLRRKRSKTNK